MSKDYYEWLDGALNLLLRQAMENELFELSPHLTQAIGRLRARMANPDEPYADAPAVTLHLALEACYHISEAIGTDEVSEDLRHALKSISELRRHDNVVLLSSGA